jgi:hypothetical protein
MAGYLSRNPLLTPDRLLLEFAAIACRLTRSLSLQHQTSETFVLGAFQPVLAKHSKHFSLQNAISIGVDEMQRNFDPCANRSRTGRNPSSAMR